MNAETGRKTTFLQGSGGRDIGTMRMLQFRIHEFKVYTTVKYRVDLKGTASLEHKKPASAKHITQAVVGKSVILNEAVS